MSKIQLLFELEAQEIVDEFAAADQIAAELDEFRLVRVSDGENEKQYIAERSNE